MSVLTACSPRCLANPTVDTVPGQEHDDCPVNATCSCCGKLRLIEDGGWTTTGQFLCNKCDDLREEMLRDQEDVA